MTSVFIRILWLEGRGAFVPGKRHGGQLPLPSIPARVGDDIRYPPWTMSEGFASAIDVGLLPRIYMQNKVARPCRRLQLAHRVLKTHMAPAFENLVRDRDRISHILTETPSADTWLIHHIVNSQMDVKILHVGWRFWKKLLFVSDGYGCSGCLDLRLLVAWFSTAWLFVTYWAQSLPDIRWRQHSYCILLLYSTECFDSKKLWFPWTNAPVSLTRCDFY